MCATAYPHVCMPLSLSLSVLYSTLRRLCVFTMASAKLSNGHHVSLSELSLFLKHTDAEPARAACVSDRCG
jgi:hypothetical protein